MTFRIRNTTPRDEPVVGTIRTADGLTVLILRHAAMRYRERVQHDLPGWPEALAHLRMRARQEGRVFDDPPSWVTPRDANGRQSQRWLVLSDCVLPLRGRRRPRAMTALVPDPESLA